MTIIDITEYTDAEELASDIEDMLKTIADQIGQKPDLEITVKEEYNEFTDADDYVIYWDGGPWAWAVDFVGGENLLGAELKGLRERSEMRVEAKTRHALVVGDYS